MRKIRVLIVDDSVVVRKIISDTVAKDPDIEVAGIARDGSFALKKIPHLNPDLITLDITMPGMDGLETLTEIRKNYPRLPVIMLSALTERAAEITLDALALGANDYVTKPSNTKDLAESIQRISDQLIPKIKAFCSHIIKPELGSKNLGKTLLPQKSFTPKNIVLRPAKEIDIVAIGVSTGGPNALAEVFSSFHADFPIPIVIVQHMPTYFTKLLAYRLNAKSPLNVMECTSRQEVLRGEVLIAPGNYHMTLTREENIVRTLTNQNPRVNSCRPSVDTLFKSVLNTYGAKTLAVVLTGMGHDGLLGCESIHKSGGSIIVQDEASNVVWGMPGFVVNANLADQVLPLKEIGPEICRLAKVGRR
ncbi:MAG: protein-glutamate methylesterase/protein-glutamine glutaminase [Nitrospinales bacterium]